MSILGRKVSVKMVVAAVALFVAVAGLLPVMTKARAREITLVARDMAFYLETDGKTANPVIEARPGETIRVVLVNRDRGMTHDFAVPAVDAATNLIDWNESTTITFDAPDEPGTYEYVCRPHLLMMKGQIIVRSGDL
jgi:plastocyanin